jgi:16S rRNA (adenine1518-N6/adenine1519-N6)-dimethyltransferase
MDLTNLNTIKSLCNKFGIHPNKSLGQNFLLDKSVVEKMAAAAELKNSDTVLEIGPGFGVLTEELLPRAGRLVVVEKDRRLAEYLMKTLKHENIKTKPEVISEDVLDFRIMDYGIGNKYKIVSNLPYQITSPILWKFLHEDPLKTDDLTPTLSLLRRGGRPELMVLMVQKEVGERICAKPGKMSVLAVMCQLYADCEFLFEVKRDKFYPAPDVDSAVIKLKIYNHPVLDCCRDTPPSKGGDSCQRPHPQPSPYKGEGDGFNEKDFIRLVKFGFSAKRKMLKNNLSGGLQKPMAEVVLAMKTAGLDEKVRAQELSVEEWIKLYSLLTD